MLRSRENNACYNTIQPNKMSLICRPTSIPICHQMPIGIQRSKILKQDRVILGGLEELSTQPREDRDHQILKGVSQHPLTQVPHCMNKAKMITQTKKPW
jgi:hypothetical protein